jgi:molybdate transport system substrate-binding protein
MRALAACVLAAALLAAGCSGSKHKLTVYAASSLTEVFQRLDPEARFEFAGSNLLAVQVEQGARADIYAAASPTSPQRLFAEGLINRPRGFATNRLVLIVPSGNPGHVTGLGSLMRQDVRLARGAKGVPAGDYAATLLARWCKSIFVPAGRCPRARTSEEQDVKGVLAKVALGEADAGFVYATDVRTTGQKVTAIPIPKRLEPTARYELAVVRSTKHRRQAEEFVRLVLGPKGRRALRHAGFGLP